METEDFSRRWREAVGDMQLEDAPFVAKGVEGYELARAMFVVLARMHGDAFVDEVAHALADRRDELLKSAVTTDVEIGQLLETSELWADFQAVEVMLETPSPFAPGERG